MKNTLQKINHIIFHLTLWPMLVLSPLGLLEQLTGAGFIIRLFTFIGLPNGYDFFVKLSIVLCVVFWITVILKAKVFKEKPFR